MPGILRLPQSPGPHDVGLEQLSDLLPGSQQRLARLKEYCNGG